MIKLILNPYNPGLKSRGQVQIVNCQQIGGLITIELNSKVNIQKYFVIIHSLVERTDNCLDLNFIIVHCLEGVIITIELT